MAADWCVLTVLVCRRAEEIEKFLQKNQNVDPSTFLGRQKHDKKQVRIAAGAQLRAALSP